MKKLLVMGLVAVFLFALCGCPQTAPPTNPSETKLLDKYKSEGNFKVTIVYFRNARCPVKVAEFLRGVENLSEGTVKLIEVDGDADRQGKDAYAIRGYPTTLFFKESGELDRRIVGPDISFEQAKKIVVELGATIKGMEKTEEKVEPEKESETPPEGEEEKKEGAEEGN